MWRDKKKRETDDNFSVRSTPLIFFLSLIFPLILLWVLFGYTIILIIMAMGISKYKSWACENGAESLVDSPILSRNLWAKPVRSVLSSVTWLKLEIKVVVIWRPRQKERFCFQTRLPVTKSYYLSFFFF